MYDSRQQSFAAHALGAHDKRSVAIDGCADNIALRRFLDRHGFAGDHGLVDCGAAFDQNTVDGNFFARAHAQTVAKLDLLERNIFLTSVGVEQACSSGTEIEQRPNGSAGAAAGAQFHDLAEQDQCCDGSCCFEVNVGIACHIARPSAQRLRKNLRRKRGDNAKSVGDAGAHADQSEHVWAAIDERGPEALKEGPASPEHHGRGQNELQPGQIDQKAVDLEVYPEPIAEHAAHGDRHQRRG